MFLLCLVSVFLHLAALCTLVFSCALRPFGALPRILNILVRHTIVSPWFVGIAYTESVCTLCGWGGGGVSYHVSLCSCLRFLSLCGLVYVWVCVRGALPWRPPLYVQHTCRLFIVLPWSVAAPYLLHFCRSFFRRVSRGARSLWRNIGDIWWWFVFVGMPFDVRGGSSFFFACGVVPWAPSLATYLVFSSTHV